MTLVTAISTACPSSEVEELTVSLLNIFESRGRAFELMEALIKQEIEDTGTSYAHLSILYTNSPLLQRTKQKFCAAIVLQPKCFPSTQSGKGHTISKLPYRRSSRN